MHTSTKNRPKSCGCSQCRRGKTSATGQAQRTDEERAYRHGAKRLLRRYVDEASDTPIPVPYGSYTD